MMDPSGGKLRGAGSLVISALALAVPVSFLPATLDVFNLVKMTVIWWGFLILLVVWAAMLSRGARAYPSTRFGVVVACFCVAVTVAAIDSRHRTAAVIGLYHRYGGLVSLLVYAGLAVIVVVTLRAEPDRARWISRATGAGAVLASCYVLLQGSGIDAFMWREPSGAIPRFPGGALGNSMFAGDHLAIALPIAVAALVGTASGAAWLSWAAVVVSSCAALWTTQSRSGLVAAVVGTLVVAGMSAKRIRRVAAVLAVALVLGAVAVTATSSTGPVAPEVAERTISSRDSLRVRRAGWGQALRIFRDDPLTGGGPDTFLELGPRYRSPAEATAFRLNAADKPHNVYLEYLATTGSLGLIAFLAILAVALDGARRSIDSVGPSHRVMLAGWTGSLTAYTAQAWFSIDVPPLAFAGWLSIGVVVALSMPPPAAERVFETRATDRPSQRAESARRPRRRAWGATVAVAIVVLVLGVLGTRPLVADVHARRAHNAEQSVFGLRSAHALYRRAISWHPREAVYHALAGRVARRRAFGTVARAEKKELLEQALAHFQEAVSLQPGNVQLLVSTAETWTAVGQQVDPAGFDRALEWWRVALAHDPHNPTVIVGHRDAVESHVAARRTG